jgi:hypothetical protein
LLNGSKTADREHLCRIFLKEPSFSGRDFLPSWAYKSDFLLYQILVLTVTTVSKPETDLSTNVALCNKFERVFSNQHGQVASMITLLEKVEGKSSSFNIPNDYIPQLNSHGVLQPNLLAVSRTSIEKPVYSMPIGFYPRQSSLPKPTMVKPPPMADLTALSGQMMDVSRNPPLVNRVDLSATMQP